MKIGDVCRNDTLTKTEEIEDWTYYVGSGLEQREALYTQSKEICDLTTKLYLFDATAGAWVDATAEPPTWGLGSNFDANVFSLELTDPAVYPAAQPYAVYPAKITVTDERALADGHLEFEFTLEIRDICADDTISLVSGIDSFNYTLDDVASELKAISYDQLYSDCSVAAAIYYKDSSGAWVEDTNLDFLDWIDALDANDGSFTAKSGDIGTWGIETHLELKVELSLPGSAMAADLTSIESEFEVYLKDPCADNMLSIAASDELGTITYYVGEAAEAVAPVVSQTVDGCTFEASLEYWDELDSTWRDYTEFTTTPG